MESQRKTIVTNRRIHPEVTIQIRTWGGKIVVAALGLFDKTIKVYPIRIIDLDGKRMEIPLEGLIPANCVSYKFELKSAGVIQTFDQAEHALRAWAKKNLDFAAV